MKYVCPDDITKLFETNKEEGRKKATEWASRLDIVIGDQVWFPEIGWMTKTQNRVQ